MHYNFHIYLTASLNCCFIVSLDDCLPFFCTVTVGDENKSSVPFIKMLSSIYFWLAYSQLVRDLQQQLIG